MGDMTDYINEEAWLDTGGLSSWWAYPYPDIFGNTCKYCGRHGFTWSKRPEGWRLTTKTGKVHKCKKYIKAKEEMIRKKINE